MNARHAAALAAAALLSASAHAADYRFDVLYFGNDVATLAPGSDNPDGQRIDIGDSFVWRIDAQDDARWLVTQTDTYYLLMSFFVLDCGSRTGDWTFNLRRGGSTVFSDSATGWAQSCVHMGVDQTFLGAGLEFDQMEVTYTLTGFVPRPGEGDQTVIYGILPLLGAPEVNAGIVYGPVPEPGTYALLLSGLGIVGAAAARRHRQRC